MIADRRGWPFLLPAGAILAILVGLWAGPRFVDWSAAKPGLEAMIADQIGITVSLQGNLSVDLLPQPRITAAGVVIEGPGASGRLRWLRGRLDPAQLLTGRLVPRDLHIVEADLSLPLAAPPSDAAMLPAAAIRIEDSRIVLTGAPDWMPAALTRLDGRIALGGPGRLLAFDGEARLEGAPVGLSLDLGRTGEIRLALAHGPSASDLAVQGRADPGGGWRGRATLVLEEAAFLSTLDADAAAQVLGTGPATADFAVDVDSAGRLMLDLESLESTRLARGSGRMVLTAGSEGVVADIALHLARLSLETGDLSPGRIGPSAARLLRQWAAGTVSLTVTADRIAHPAGDLRDVAMEMAVAGGLIAVDRVSLEAPGGSAIRLSGTLVPPDPARRGAGWLAEGEASLRTDDMRALAAWAGAPDLSAWLPGDRGRRAALESGFSLQEEAIRIGPLSGQIDETGLDGTLLLPKAGGWEAVITADSINLDRYTNTAAWPALPALLAGWAKGGAGTASDRPAATRLAIALDRVILGGIPGGGITLLAEREAGAAEAELALADLAGAQLRASLYQAGAELRLALRGDIPAPDRLAGALGLAPRLAAGLARFAPIRADADLSLAADGTLGYAAQMIGTEAAARVNGVLRPGPAAQVSLSDGAVEWDGFSLFGVSGQCRSTETGGAWRCEDLQAAMPGLDLQAEADYSAPLSDENITRRLTVTLTEARADAGVFLASTGLPIILEGPVRGNGALTGTGSGLSGAVSTLTGVIALNGLLAMRLHPEARENLASVGRVSAAVDDAFGAPSAFSGTVRLAPDKVGLEGKLTGQGANADMVADMRRTDGTLTAALSVQEPGRREPALTLQANGPLKAPALNLGGSWISGR